MLSLLSKIKPIPSCVCKKIMGFLLLLFYLFCVNSTVETDILWSCRQCSEILDPHNW